MAIPSQSHLPAEFSLTGHTAIVASAGGDETPFLAAALAEAGALVFAVARRQFAADAIADAVWRRLRARHRTPTWDAGTRPMRPPRLSMPSPPSILRVDILVNDTRSFFAKPASEISMAEWDELHARNVRATFMLSQAVGQRMLGQQYGRIVNVISNLAERAVINCSAYSATQAAVLSLTRSLAVEWGRSEVRVNAVGSGWSTAEDIPLETQREELLVRYTPMRRKGHPRDLAAMLVYLCSPHCDYPSGQPVYIDGGLNAHP